MVNLKSNIPTKGPIWKRFTIYVALISSLAASPVMASADVGDMDKDQILINRPHLGNGADIVKFPAMPEADEGSVEGVEMAMLFSCWRTNYVEIGYAGCYQL